MSTAPKLHAKSALGPWTADMIKPGEPYEISNGYRIECMSTGQRGSLSNLAGGIALDTDPTAPRAGVDPGISPVPPLLRAPDIGVGGLANAPGWSSTAPPLFVEYADVGQDEDKLDDKIEQLFKWGTRFIWVVRMNGPRRVEVHERGNHMRIVGPSGVLRAPGILKNPVPIDALYDRDAAHEQALTNLLQRKGYENLDAVKAEGLVAMRSALRLVLKSRKLAVSAEDDARIDACNDLATLQRWHAAAIDAPTVEHALT
jgi:hypothetical protein